MKKILKTVIIYSLIMLILLGVICIRFNSFELSNNGISSYSEQELSTYKKVWENIKVSYEMNRAVILRSMVIIWAVILALGYIFIFMIYMFRLKPVEEMEKYAMEIAKGNLDIPLPVRKGNMSDSFTESFDLMREELKKSKQKEMEAEKAKKELVGELSHDIKTPVATIQATCEVLDMNFRKKKAELLEKGSSDNNIGNAEDIDGILEKIGYIRTKSETINNLVGNLFKATIEDLDEISIRTVETDSKVVEGFFDSMKEYGNIILKNHIPECLIYMDRLRMEQVIDNIVGNSYKYAGTDIYVSFDEFVQKHGTDGKEISYIRIIIRDEGPGVNEDELPLITSKYYRGKNTGEKQGYGLGLYLVNRYMEKQGGGFEFYNENGFVTELFLKKV